MIDFLIYSLIPVILGEMNETNDRFEDYCLKYPHHLSFGEKIYCQAIKNGLTFENIHNSPGAYGKFHDQIIKSHVDSRIDFEQSNQLFEQFKNDLSQEKYSPSHQISTQIFTEKLFQFQDSLDVKREWLNSDNRIIQIKENDIYLVSKGKGSHGNIMTNVVFDFEKGLDGSIKEEGRRQIHHLCSSLPKTSHHEQHRSKRAIFLPIFAIATVGIGSLHMKWTFDAHQRIDHLETAMKEMLAIEYDSKWKLSLDQHNYLSSIFDSLLNRHLFPQQMLRDNMNFLDESLKTRGVKESAAHFFDSSPCWIDSCPMATTITIKCSITETNRFRKMIIADIGHLNHDLLHRRTCNSYHSPLIGVEHLGDKYYINEEECQAMGGGLHRCTSNALVKTNWNWSDRSIDHRFKKETCIRMDEDIGYRMATHPHGPMILFTAKDVTLTLKTYFKDKPSFELFLPNDTIILIDPRYIHEVSIDGKRKIQVPEHTAIELIFDQSHLYPHDKEQYEKGFLMIRERKRRVLEAIEASKVIGESSTLNRMGKSVDSFLSDLSRIKLLCIELFVSLVIVAIIIFVIKRRRSRRDYHYAEDDDD